jgi:hypothetical protein
MQANQLPQPRLITSVEQHKRERERARRELAELKEQAFETLLESQELLREADQALARR